MTIITLRYHAKICKNGRFCWPQDAMEKPCRSGRKGQPELFTLKILAALLLPTTGASEAPLLIALVGTVLIAFFVAAGPRGLP